MKIKNYTKEINKLEKDRLNLIDNLHKHILNLLTKSLCEEGVSSTDISDDYAIDTSCIKQGLIKLFIDSEEFSEITKIDLAMKSEGYSVTEISSVNDKLRIHLESEGSL